MGATLEIEARNIIFQKCPAKVHPTLKIHPRHLTASGFYTAGAALKNCRADKINSSIYGTKQL